MTNEEILEQQVEALEKLLQLRTAIVGELEAKVAKLQAEKYNNLGPGYYSPISGHTSIGSGILGQGTNGQVLQGGSGTGITWTNIPNNTIPNSAGTITINTQCHNGHPHHYDNTSYPACCSVCGMSQMTGTGITTSGYIGPY
jgi:hypothetical protein